VGDWDRAALERLRSAVYRHDGAAGVAVLRSRPLVPVLQYAGDVLVDALAQGVPDAPERARRCLDELTGRGLPGDAELARELSAALGLPREDSAPVPVPVDLGALGTELDGEPDGDGYVVDLKTGDVLPVGSLNGEESGTPDPAFDASGDGYEPDRWLEFWPHDAHVRQDMADFAAMTADEELRAALTARNPVWRFMAAVRRSPEDFRWLLFQEERQRGRARAWLAGHGYRTT
jgi:hypothetical protein